MQDELLFWRDRLDYRNYRAVISIILIAGNFFPVQKTQPAFHPLAQRNASRFRLYVVGIEPRRKSRLLFRSGEMASSIPILPGQARRSPRMSQVHA